MARWEEALDAQLDLYLYTNSERGRVLTDAWGRSFGRVSSVQASLTEGLADRIVATAFNADTFYVDNDMQTLWEAATATFEPEPLQAQDLLAETGFVWLPRPFMWRDKNGKRVAFRAFAWHETDIDYATPSLVHTRGSEKRTGRGVVLLVFHRAGDVDDIDMGHGIRWDNVSVETDGVDPHPSMKADGVVPYAEVVPGAPMHRGDLTIDHMMPWVYGGRYTDYDTSDGSPANVQKFAQCLWRLMQQTIATRVEAKPGGQFARRAERAKMYERKVTVIKLRRPRAEPKEGGEPVEVAWTHRWLVSGHWRNQPYPSLGPGVTRQIWISPYVKGDPSLPLEIRKARVFELVR